MDRSRDRVPDVLKDYLLALRDVASDGYERNDFDTDLRKFRRIFFKDDRVRHDNRGGTTEKLLPHYGAGGGTAATEQVGPAGVEVGSDDDEEEEENEVNLCTYIRAFPLPFISLPAIIRWGITGCTRETDV